jgi:hypothetical protein
MMKLRDWRYYACLTISSLLVVLPAPASAQILVGDNFPITTAEEFQSGPAVAVNPPAGEFLVVWHDLRPFGATGFDIFGQRLASDGTPIGTGFPVTAAGGSRPALAFNSTTNEYLVVYDRVFGGILGQRIAANGSLIGGEFPISGGVSQANDAANAYNSVSNEYLIVWGQPGGGVQGRIVNAEGVPVTATFDLSTGLVGAGDPAVVFNVATNQYCVVWDAFASPFFPGIAEIFGRLVNANGSFAGPFFAITAANEIQAFPSVTLNPVANQYLVVWTDDRNTGVTFGDIFGQLVNANGSLAGGNVPISTFPFNEGLPSVAYAPATDQYLSVWVGQPSNGPDVFGRLLAADANPLGESFQISTNGTAQSFTDLAVNPGTNVFLSVWPDDRNGAVSNTDIFGQLITAPTPVIRVDIDIRPGRDPNSISPASQGVIPVAILTTDTFDATTAYPTTVTFGATGSEAGPVRSAQEDVDGDGDADLILHFNTQATGIRCGSVSASLSGNTFSGQVIQGSDSIKTVGCSSPECSKGCARELAHPASGTPRCRGHEDLSKPMLDGQVTNQQEREEAKP